MTLPVSTDWWSVTSVDARTSKLVEVHVTELLRCNVWYVRGRERDLIIDTGLGISSLRAVVPSVIGRDVVVVATHSHYDHIGGLDEFPVRLGHAAEAAWCADPSSLSDPPTLLGSVYPDVERKHLCDAGYEVPDVMVAAIPHHGWDPAEYVVRPAPLTGHLDEGDVVDLGDVAFQVLHVPGHSPGSIALWEPRSGTLFSGDAVYDGPLLDELEGSDIHMYLATMERLRRLDAAVVHGGHGPSFDGERLREICDGYLNRRSKWRR
jgi:glyoxylase-like metal-dependent hydrolase (beta-lactamase superfamily II)